LRSPDCLRVGLAVFGRELRNLLAARALWLMLLVLCPLVGYGFIQAVTLFSEASRSALQFPELARGMSPLDGILVPTFGAFYLAMTLLFPFVAIRAVAQEKQNGALKLVLQLPLGVPALIGWKVLAVGAVWLLALLPALSAVLIWRLLGGHVYGPELANLLLGHALYGLVITNIAFFAAAVAESPATAAIVTLAFTIGFWVLDFAAGSGPGWLVRFAPLSLTATLRAFERGLFSVPQAIQSLVLAAALLAATILWLPTGVSRRHKGWYSTAVVAASILVVLAAGQARWYIDAAEDRRNSFNPADEAALRQMTLPLAVTLYLSPEDSRAREMESNVLAKLRRVVPRLEIRYGPVSKIGLFGAPSDDRYGLVIYEYQGKRDESRSSSEPEILPLLHGLAGRKVTPVELPTYPGYPLGVSATPASVWFYGVLPVAVLAGWWWVRRRKPNAQELELSSRENTA
jgi:ABC-2 type transport system permease protein